MRIVWFQFSFYIISKLPLSCVWHSCMLTSSYLKACILYMLIHYTIVVITQHKPAMLEYWSGLISVSYFFLGQTGFVESRIHHGDCE